VAIIIVILYAYPELYSVANSTKRCTWGQASCANTKKTAEKQNLSLKQKPNWCKKHNNNNNNQLIKQNSTSRNTQ